MTSVNFPKRAGTLPDLSPNFIWTARKRSEDLKTVGAIRSAFYGLANKPAPLLTYETAKTEKGDGLKIVNLSLAPHSMSGFNVCPCSTSECRANCIGHTAGLNQFETQQIAKLWRTQLLFTDFACFMRLLLAELNAVVRNNKAPIALRLNTYSDLNWSPVEHLIRDAIGPDSIRFEYTKRKEFVSGSRSVSHLLFSSSKQEYKNNVFYAFSGRGPKFDSPEFLNSVIERGHNVAVVVDQLPTTKTLWGKPWMSGDANDRNVYLVDGHYLLLTPKGTLSDGSNFVYPIRNVDSDKKNAAMEKATRDSEK